MSADIIQHPSAPPPSGEPAPGHELVGELTFRFHADSQIIIDDSKAKGVEMRSLAMAHLMLGAALQALLQGTPQKPPAIS